MPQAPEKAQSCSQRATALCRSTPALLYSLALAAVAGGAALVYYVPDTSTAEIVGQLLGGGALLGAAGAALFGANLLSSLQK